MTDRDVDAGCTKDKRILFASHGNPWRMQRLTCRRAHPKDLPMRGFKEKGATP